MIQVLPAFSVLGGTVCLSDEEHRHSGLAAGVSETEEGNRVELPVVYQDKRLGVLVPYFSDGQMPNEQDEKLLQTLSGQLGISVANNRVEQECRLFAVLQERSLVAQGLHDSIVQALAFSNLQVQMLEGAFASNQHEQAGENISLIKDGVQECYEDVRELLMNFRTRVGNKDFFEAVGLLLARFERQTGIPVDPKRQDDGQALNYGERLQIIFILQGSPSNIREHACMQYASVEAANHGDFITKIQGDSAGFSQEHLSDRPSGEHVGLGIMQGWA